MNTNYSLFWLACLISISLAACGDDPVSYTEPVGLELKIESGKVVGDSVSGEKSITTESGNPYGAFVNAARDTLGRDPSTIALASATIQLGATSTGVSALNQVFDGEASVLFSMDTTNDTFTAATLTINSGTEGRGPLDMDPVFDSTDISTANMEKLLSGSFKVVLTGPTQADFAGLGAKADVQVTLILEAYE